MSGERLQAVLDLFREACDLSQDERVPFLDTACNEDHQLQAEVESMLAFDDTDDEEEALQSVRTMLSDLACGAGPASVPEAIGGYRIVRLIAEGGMGVVYEAMQDNPARRVAIKVARSGGATQDRIGRFKLEVQLLAGLRHPGIAQIIEAGTADPEEGGQPFFVMEFVEGRSITDYATAHPGSVRQKLELMVRVCEPVAFAHRRGVIHRDLKPDNVLVGDDGAPKVLDFGVAKVAEAGGFGAATLQTEAGRIFGTLGYMAPEQFGGSSEGLTSGADVYSLGVIIFEILSGRLPHELDAATFPRGLAAVTSTDAPNLGDLRPECRGDIEAIVAKALERDPRHRYPDAAALNADIGRYLRGKPVVARPAGPLLRFVRWSQRNRALAAMTLAMTLILVLGIVVSTVFALDARYEAEEKGRALDEKSAALNRWARLADARRVADLVQEGQEDLWPAVPRKISRMEEWLKRARDVAGRFSEHEVRLASLREQAEPYTEADRLADRARHAQELGRLELIVHDLSAFAEKKKERERLEAELVELEEKETLSRADQHRRRFLNAPLHPGPRVLTAADRDARWRQGEATPWVFGKDPEALEREREELERRVSRRRTWRFADEQSDFRHQCLMDLVAGLKSLTGATSPMVVTIKGMEERLDLARRLRDRLAGEDREAWALCLADTGRPGGPGDGLPLEPIAGLVPLGKDRDSGFWEFWHVASGERPAWEGEPLGLGAVSLHPSFGREGLVLVLIPGDVSQMGERLPDAEHPPGSPNTDPNAETDSSLVHEVTLEAFLISKFEVTQGQWLRQWGENPSDWAAGLNWSDSPMTLRNPVENVNWDSVSECCRRCDGVVPTEAQWEYACRAGTTSPWSSGWEEGALEGHANVCDTAYVQYWKPIPGVVAVPWNDGQTVHGPVGSFAANGFWLYDMHGNVAEWCRDGYSDYGYWKPRAADGLRGPLAGVSYRVGRGGSFCMSAIQARSSVRSFALPGYRSRKIGFRFVRPWRP